MFDLKLRRSYRGTPVKQGYERDLYRADTNEDDPFFIERAMADTIEAPFSQILERVSRRQTLPDNDEDRNTLFNFVALQSARVPATRDSAKAVLSHGARQFIRRLSENSAELEKVKRNAADAGVPIDASFEDMRELARRLEVGRINIEPSRNLLHDQMFRQMDRFLPLIARRPWHLLVAEDKASDFICSDRPLVVTWPQSHPPSGQLEAWLRGAHLTFPLTRRLALISNLNLRDDGVRSCPAGTVSALNKRIARKADRFLYSSAQGILEETLRGWKPNIRAV